MFGARRWAFLGSAAFALILVGETLRQGALLVLALPLVCYLAVGFYFALPKIELKAQRRVSDGRVLSGEAVTVRVEVENLGERLEVIELADNVPTVLELRRGSSQKIKSLPAQGKTALEYVVSGVRGLARWQSLSVTVTDTLGLFIKTLELPWESELLIVPTFERLDEILMRPRRTRIFSGQVKARLGGNGHRVLRGERVLSRRRATVHQLEGDCEKRSADRERVRAGARRRRDYSLGRARAQRCLPFNLQEWEGELLAL
uniref:Hypothetical conserved protein n=1 Tax=Acetithermum autotrophicum TaxID=1446466 RepID=H5SVS8_ACEAU|nr:hypothetical conserved protein [Candidatus Acetothermum autotrophicum]